MPIRDLIELMLDFTGKDTQRIQDLLLRGPLSAGHPLPLAGLADERRES